MACYQSLKTHWSLVSLLICGDGDGYTSNSKHIKGQLGLGLPELVVGGLEGGGGGDVEDGGEEEVEQPSCDHH